MSDLYSHLNLPKDAPHTEVRKAYLRKAKRSHPDNGGDPAEFGKAQHAYLVLRNPERRAEYDRTGQDPGELVDNEQSQVLTTITQLLAKYVIEGETAFYKNIIDSMITDLQLQENEQAKFREQNKINRNVIERMLKRFSRKRKKNAALVPNMIELALKGQLALIDGAEVGLVAATKLRKAVKAELENYDFEALPIIQQQNLYAGMQGQASAQNAYGIGRIW